MKIIKNNAISSLFLFFLTTTLSLGQTSYLTQNVSHQRPTDNFNRVKNQLNKENFVITDYEPLADLQEEAVEEVGEFEMMLLAEISKALNFRKREPSVMAIIDEAKTFIGTPYRYGGTTRTGIDCSAFMQTIFRVTEIELPRVSASQAHIGETIDFGNIEKGDLLFFSNSPNARISHVGMVVEVSDEIYFIHAATSTGVTVSPLSMAYWDKRFRFAKRVFGEN
ncbi:MAG: C40 family peptidase [Weeksellaceae bacterium]|nr:C40 family peptidase [Weeksellaceae bacterium]